MEAFRLEAGLCGQIFGPLLEIRLCLTKSLFTQTWQYCKELDIDLTTDIVDFKLPWQGDQEIMRIFLQSGIMGKNLIELNQCHMYLQAIFLSNICNGTGTAIDPQMCERKVQCTSIYE